MILVVYGGYAIVDGGLQIDGREIRPVDIDQVLQACRDFHEDGIQEIVICGVYSPIDTIACQEKSCKKFIQENFERFNVTCSSDGKRYASSPVLWIVNFRVVGGLGLLERENTAILNAAICAYASRVFSEIESCLRAN